MSLKQFVETVQPKDSTKLYVYLDSKIYPNEFGISVRPLQVKYGSTVLDMSQLIDLFGKVPYITVRESRYRTVYRDPMLMTVDLNPKQFEDKTYYDYYIDKLCLRSELKRYEAIYTKAHAVLRGVHSINDFRDMDSQDE